jgi:single-stranded-DNA-specific exonuclease
MQSRRWDLAETAPQEFFGVLSGTPRVVAQLLWNRGIRTANDADIFLHPSYERDVYAPHRFSQMAAAVQRIFVALEQGERIAIYGDYDADGVTGSAILAVTLRALARAMGKERDFDLEVYLPHRDREGYGVHEAAVRELASRGTQLMITVDCGIANRREIAVAATLGIQTIVVDHHEVPPELPEAILVHPGIPGETYPNRNLPAAGVALKVAEALANEAGERGILLPPGFSKWLLDLASIALVTEIVPLTGENRALLHYGLLVLNKTRRPGLRKLMEAARLTPGSIGSREIGFQIGPRINAAGRMDHAITAYSLLTAENDEDAARLAAELNLRNTERQARGSKMLAEAREVVGVPGDAPLLSVVREGWPPSLLGLIAGRLTDEHYRPALVIGRNGEECVGSGRSIPEFHITRALQEAGGFLHKFGGHPQACGFSIHGEENLRGFLNQMAEIASRELSGTTLVPRLPIDAELAPTDAGPEIFDALAAFAPFGEGNAKPRFLAKSMRAGAVRRLGATGKHLAFRADDGRRTMRAIAFGMGERAEEVSSGRTVDVVYELDKNSWMGRDELEMKVVDFRANAG